MVASGRLMEAGISEAEYQESQRRARKARSNLRGDGHLQVLGAYPVAHFCGKRERASLKRPTLEAFWRAAGAMFVGDAEV